MAIIIPPETMEAMNVLSGELVKVAYSASEHAVELREDSTAESIAAAQAVQTVIFAISSILQSVPLSEHGALLAMASMSGTVMGQCSGDRRQLYEVFKSQMATTLAEIAAARMPAEGEA